MSMTATVATRGRDGLRCGVGGRVCGIAWPPSGKMSWEEVESTKIEVGRWAGARVVVNRERPAYTAAKRSCML